MASFSSAYASGSPTPSSTSAHSLASDGNTNSSESAQSPDDFELLSSTCSQYERLISLYTRRLTSLRAVIPPTSDPTENVAAYEIVETEVCL